MSESKSEKEIDSFWSGLPKHQDVVWEQQCRCIPWERDEPSTDSRNSKTLEKKYVKKSEEGATYCGKRRKYRV